MPSRPAITIIVPVHNRERTVGQTIASVLAQTRRDFELIIWDDGSTDASRRVIDKGADGDPRVRIESNGTNLGLARTLVKAHALAQGPYIGWVDSDDWIAPTTLERTGAVLDRKPAVGMVYTDHTIVDGAGKPLGMGVRCDIPYSKERLLVDFMTFHFRLFRRAAFEQAGGINTTFATAQDYDFCLRMSEITQIEHLRDPLYFYRRSEDSISNVKRLEQIESSARAIREALARRKLDDKYRLEVEVVGRFAIRPRTQGENAWSQA